MAPGAWRADELVGAVVELLVLAADRIMEMAVVREADVHGVLARSVDDLAKAMDPARRPKS